MACKLRPLLVIVTVALGCGAHGLPHYDQDGPVFNEVVIVKGSFVPFQSAIIPRLSAVACLEAFCTSSTGPPVSPASSELQESTAHEVSNPKYIGSGDRRLNICLLESGNQSFTWILDKRACTSLTVIAHEPFSVGIRSSTRNFAVPAEATVLDIAIQLPMPCIQQILQELQWRLVKSLGELPSLADLNLGRLWKTTAAELALILRRGLRDNVHWILTLWAVCALWLFLGRNNATISPKRHWAWGTAHPTSSQRRKHGASEYSVSAYDDRGRKVAFDTQFIELRDGQNDIWDKLVSNRNLRAILAARCLGHQTVNQSVRKGP